MCLVREWQWFSGEVQTACDAKLDAGIDEERKTNGTLSTTEEPLRPINRIKRPRPYTSKEKKRKLPKEKTEKKKVCDER
jgi:hypothetical protein